jgi:hypothetical protein
MLTAGLATLFDIGKLCFHDAGNADFCTNFDLAGRHFRVIAVSADLAALLHFTVAALFARFVILQNLNGHLAGMKAFFTNLCRRFLILFSEFKLKPAALEVFVKALEGLDDIAHYVILLFYLLKSVDFGDMMGWVILMKKFVLFLSSLILSVSVLASNVYAHSGGTDENGGHTDHSTGDYHYHHGYPAHDHYDMDGDGDLDCPYEFDDRTGYTSGATSGHNSSYGTQSASGNQSSSTMYSAGYDAGYADGKESGYDAGYEDGKDAGYERGYKKGYINGEADMEIAMDDQIDAANDSLWLSAIIGTPVLVILISFIFGRIRDKRENLLYSEIRTLKKQLYDERNIRVLDADVSSIRESAKNIPENVRLISVFLPVKGNATKQKPYGEYTAFASQYGSSYHCKYNCCNATTPMHIFQILGNLKPCARCVPKEMQQNSLPEWYREIIKRKI